MEDEFDVISDAMPKKKAKRKYEKESWVEEWFDPEGLDMDAIEIWSMTDEGRTAQKNCKHHYLISCYIPYNSDMGCGVVQYTCTKCYHLKENDVSAGAEEYYI